MADMEYRRLGRSGLQVSVLSFGSWVSFGAQLDTDAALGCLDVAYQGGMNFFDNAEAYAGGDSERIMGEAIRQLGWPRHSYVISTKLFWGIHGGVNMSNTLNRKYLLQADRRLARAARPGVRRPPLLPPRRSEHADRGDGVGDVRHRGSSGQATYWGTSEWTADEIRAAWDIADRHHLHKPVVEQPQYNVLNRRRVEREYARLYEDIGLGLTTWSPLASGLLTGKYLDGVPEGSRATLPGYEWLAKMLTDPASNEKVRELQTISGELRCSLAQLAIAWCAKNPNVSSVITGASRPEQVTDNLGALDVVPLLDEDVMKRIKAAVR